MLEDHATSPVCSNGDTIIYDGRDWAVIPSGDEPSGTVTSVGISVPNDSGLTVSDSPITTYGTINIGIANGYAIPTTADQNTWNGKQDAIIDGSATIASESNNIVTLKAGISQSAGAIANNSVASDITLAKVAKTGSYADLTNTPTDVSAFTNDSGYQTASDVSTAISTGISGKQDVIDADHKLSASNVSGLATVATSGSYSDLSGAPTAAAAASGGTTACLCTTGNKYTWNNRGTVVTSNPSSNNTSTGDAKFVILSTEPTTYRTGYIYFITE